MMCHVPAALRLLGLLSPRRRPPGLLGGMYNFADACSTPASTTAGETRGCAVPTLALHRAVYQKYSHR